MGAESGSATLEGMGKWGLCLEVMPGTKGVHLQEDLHIGAQREAYFFEERKSYVVLSSIFMCQMLFELFWSSSLFKTSPVFHLDFQNILQLVSITIATHQSFQAQSSH
ncbi:hypothetical protein GOODEAATRI_004345 [Goodea atripinnis]|uniref:Uncharacterized protein n=1 Tax=Goodea atripinnis TaxID=208336 RepID=A0ABV0NIX9_9TELE